MKLFSIYYVTGTILCVFHLHVKKLRGTERWNNLFKVTQLLMVKVEYESSLALLITTSQNAWY